MLQQKMWHSLHPRIKIKLIHCLCCTQLTKNRPPGGGALSGFCTQIIHPHQKFNAAWRMSFNRFLGLPSILPNTVLQKILHSTEATCSEAAARNARKVIQRFEEGFLTNLSEDNEEEENKDDTEYNQRNSSHALCFKAFARNFKVLFVYTPGGTGCAINAASHTTTSLSMRTSTSSEDSIKF
jgi:hypothetical protein